MRQIERSVEIAASSERVWEVLADFGGYRDWNPFLLSVSGQPVQGARLRVRIRPRGRRALTFRPRVTVAIPGRELRWLGQSFVPGLLDGEHAFVLHPLGAGACLLVQTESFRGLLVGLAGKELDAIADGFDRMNQALRSRAEERTDRSA